MTAFELTELLCDIIRIQTDIIERQTEALMQADIPEEVRNDLERMQKQADALKARTM